MTVQPADLQVERVLDDLIHRLSEKESTKETRAVLIEARRLKNVTMRWGAIPPPPDARREMLTRVMELVAALGAPISDTVKTPSGGALSNPRPKSNPRPSAQPDPRSSSPPNPPSYPRRSPVLSPPPSGPPSRRSPASLALTEPAMSAVPSPLPPAVDARTVKTAKSAAYRSDPPEHRHSSPGPQSGARVAYEAGFETPPGRPGETLAGIAASSPPDEPQRRRSSQSNFPTAPPPAIAASLDMRPASSPKNQQTGGSAAPVSPRLGGFGEGRGRTLMQGSQGVSDALEALADAKVPRMPRIDPATDDPAVPRGAEPRSTLKPARSAPSQGALSASTPSPSPVRAVGIHGVGNVEGFSKSLSAPNVPVSRSSRPGSPSNPPKIPTLGPGTGGTSKSARPATQALFAVEIADAVREVRASARPAGAKSTPPGTIRTLIGPGVTIVRPEGADWSPHPVAPGVTMKVLFRDPRSGVLTALVRLAPGAEIPRRRHAAPEELYLVAGTAMVGEHEMRAGDYSRAESETTHERIRSEHGCTFFLCGSEHDELLDET